MDENGEPKQLLFAVNLAITWTDRSELTEPINTLRKTDHLRLFIRMRCHTRNSDTIF